MACFGTSELQNGRLQGPLYTKPHMPAIPAAFLKAPFAGVCTGILMTLLSSRIKKFCNGLVRLLFLSALATGLPVKPAISRPLPPSPLRRHPPPTHTPATTSFTCPSAFRSRAYRTVMRSSCAGLGAHGNSAPCSCLSTQRQQQQLHHQHQHQHRQQPPPPAPAAAAAAAPREALPA
jgi:hypothetical protein